jgi:membrane-bound ClpP family serine protease
VPISWLAVATVLVALTLVAAEGFVPRRGLTALSGAVALAAAVPALLHPVGLQPPLVVAVIAALAGVVLVASRLSGRLSLPLRRRSQV